MNYSAHLIFLTMLSVCLSSEVFAGTPGKDDAKKTVKSSYIKVCGNIRTCVICYSDGTCTEVPASSPECPPGTTEQGKSIVDNWSFNHIHYAWDWKLGATDSACSTCNGGNGSSKSIMEMALRRYHRFRDATDQSSFGPGVFQSFDITLSLMRNGDTNRARVFHPHLLAPISLDDGLNFGNNGDVKDGIYVDSYRNVMQEMRLKDTGGSLTTDIYQAKSAVLKAYDGKQFLFDIFPLGGPAQQDLSGTTVWKHMDLGTVSTPGGASYGVTQGFNVQGSGANIWDAADGLRFVYQSISGDFDIKTRVASVQNIDQYSKAGVMVRQSTAANSVEASMIVTPAGKYNFLRRATTGGATTKIEEGGATFPTAWVRLVRTGTTVRAYKGANTMDVGQEWAEIGSLTLSTDPVLVGMCVTSRLDGTLCAAQFRNLSCAPTPGAWTSADIGTSTAGSTTDLGTASTFQLQSSGTNLWDKNDEGHFIYQALRGDGSLTARVESMSQTNSYAKVGVMIRESLAADSKRAAMVITAGANVAFHWRDTTGANANKTEGAVVLAPQWVRITRTGNTLAGSHSADGVTWTSVGSQTIAMGTDVYIGLAGSATHDGALCRSTFDNVSLSGTPTPAEDWPATGLSGFLAGRLTRIENRNGYGVSLTYKYNASNPSDTTAIAESPERQFQIDTVTDHHNRQMTFTYGASQVSARWVVSQIELPNGQTIDYSYADGQLTQINHPDGTVSTFSASYDADSNCTVMHYNDAAGDGDHRRKDAYLSSNFQLTVADHLNEVPFVWNSASLLVRMITKDDEVVYMNVFNPDDPSRVKIYSDGTVREMSDWVRQVRYFKEGWTFTPGAGYSSIQGTLEDTFYSEPQGDFYKNYIRGCPTTSTTETSVTRQFTYTSANRYSKVTYSDATTEEYSYGPFALVTRYKDRLNRVTKFTYDARGNMLTKQVGILYNGVTDVNQPEHATYSWEYYSSGHANQFLLKTEFDANYNPGQSDLHRTDYEYDTNQFLVKKIEGADVASGARAELEYTYDAAGRLATSADALGRMSTFAYDTRDRVVKITYSDDSTERFIYGTGTDANVLVKQKDRNGNVTKFEYDNFGRKVKTITAYSTMALDDSETLITDVSVKVEEICTFNVGTTLKKTCLRSGELNEYTYDYRNRLKTSKVYTRQGLALTSTQNYVNNLLFSSEDPYGRKTYHNYRTSDRAHIRVVRGTLPTYSLADFTAVAAATRDLSNNAAYVIDDSELDAERQTVARIDGRNIRHTTNYDSRGRAVEMIEAESMGGVASADAAKTQYVYDANSNRTRIKHPRTFTEASNFFTDFTYTGRNLLASQTEAVGKAEAATMSYTYLLDKRLSETVDGNGKTWEQTWKDCCGRIATKVDPLLADNTRPYTYFQQDFYGNTTHTVRLKDFATFAGCCMTDPLDGDTIYETTTKFDARHRPVAQTVWLVARGAVDPNDVPVAGENGVPSTDGLTTKWHYDENLTDGIGIDADYSTQLAARLGAGYFGSNVNGYAVETTNPAGEKTVTVYDGTGRLVLQIDGNKNSVKSTFDVVVGNLLETSVADGINHVTKSRADGVGRVRESTDAESKVTTFEYDANSNRVKLRDANGVGQDCVFDDRNRDKQCADTAATPSVMKKTFDAHNNVTVSTDALNKNTVCVFDARDRKVSCTDRISGVTAFIYDKNNNLTKITDAESGVTDYVYDPRNLLSTETFPAHNKADGHYDIREYTYDAANRLKTRKDQLLEVTTYNYDLANRLLSRVYPDALNDTFTYDAASRLLSAANARYNNLVTREYTLGGEAAGRLKRETQTIGAVPYQINYAYDAANRQTSVTYPTGDVVARAFTDRNQLSYVDFNGNTVASFLYDNGMRRSQTTFGNGVVEDRTYFTDNLNSTIKANKGASKITDFTYSWDVNKRKTAEADGIVPPVNSQTFSYDDQDRLTGFARNNGDTQSWNLSLVGDWNTFTKNGNAETRQHNDAHEIKQVGATAVSHDVKGNLTANSNGQSYVWDIENRLKQAVVPTGSTIGVVGSHNYAYDALGRRVSKTVGGITTVFVNDGLQEICEYDNGAFARSYVFGTYIDEPLRMTSAAGMYYYHANQIYSIAALTDAAGTAVERYTYDPYGKATVLDGAGSITGIVSSKGNPWTFTGRRLDTETGLMYYRARMYSTELGRFMGRDPLLDLAQRKKVGTYSTTYHSKRRRLEAKIYEFVLSSPSTYIDPMGMEETQVTDTGPDPDKPVSDALSDLCRYYFNKAKCSAPIAQSPTALTILDPNTGNPIPQEWDTKEAAEEAAQGRINTLFENAATTCKLVITPLGAKFTATLICCKDKGECPVKKICSPKPADGKGNSPNPKDWDCLCDSLPAKPPKFDNPNPGDF